MHKAKIFIVFFVIIFNQSSFGMLATRHALSKTLPALRIKKSSHFTRAGQKTTVCSVPYQKWLPSKQIISREEMMQQLPLMPVNHETRREIARLLEDHDRHTKKRLDLIFSLPWGIASEKIIPFSVAKEILNQEFTGMQPVKELIFDSLAVHLINKNNKLFVPSVWCLVGPPGVGKTAICKVIAKAMGRTYERVALGGVRDEATIRGHSSTYVGAIPGRILEAFKRAGSGDPLLALDEIDKIGRDGMQGSLGAALLELLDPEQNKKFHDHFLGIPFNISGAFIVATANDINHISDPLKDRMKIIHVPGYTLEEKIAITQKHLIKKACAETGLTMLGKEIQLDDAAIKVIVEDYAPEEGVRHLDQCIRELCARQARAHLENEKPLIITKDTITTLLGRAKPKKKHLGF